ncbi:DUF1963 domain-containing protein, partial [Sphingopyxis sp.]|uniref:DUF1963 domain-containing protein n=1 Tax=Sphingopyxis sp. TaxID=1908224 RepID=UPI002EDB3E09
MDQLQSAALTLAGATLVFLAIVVAIWWLRRPRTAPAAPRAPRPPRAPGESRLPRLPKLPRKANPELDHVEMAPSRLARISRKTPLDQLSDGGGDDGESRSTPDPVADHESASVETMLESKVAEVEQVARDADAHGTDTDEEESIDEAGSDEPEIGEPGAEAVTLRLVPQIPPRDAISTSSWLGGRPRLPGGMEWPKIGGEPADFLAQIDCAGLPPDLWHGCGPRDGALAFFIHRRNPDVRVFHLRDTDAPVAPPQALDDRDGWFAPYGGIGFGDLA